MKTSDKNTMIKIFATATLGGVLLLLLSTCAEANKALDAAKLLSPLSFPDTPEVIGSNPAPGAVGVSATSPISVLFSKDMDSRTCTSAFSISPSVSGRFSFLGSAMTYTPPASSSTGSCVTTVCPPTGFSAGTTYVFNIASTCEDTTGRDLARPYTASFTVAGGGGITPAILAVGVASQASCAAGTAVGGNTGAGSWVGTGACWWDNGLSMLSPVQYQFQGGNAACGTDTSTDNFIIIFNQAMNPSTTVNAASLRRVSAPTGTAILADWSWSANNSVLRVSFAEQTIATTCAPGNSGALDLQSSAGVGPHNYILTMDTTATSALGTALPAQFTFSMSGH